MYLSPPVMLPFDVVSLTILSRWTDYITDDPYKNIAYQWTMTLAITPQKHGDKFTPTPYAYNGLDIETGMWLSNKPGGYVYKIINIHDGSTETSITVDVEDVDRFNLMLDPSRRGTGAAPSSSTSGFIFSLDSSGIPVFPGIVTGAISSSFQADIQSRFSYRNEALQYIRVNQPGHTFSIGDIISPDSANVGMFIPASSSKEIEAIGTVTDIDIPSADYFNYRPFGKILYNISPAFTGNYGDIYYLDPANPGKLTTSKPANHIKPIYIQIDNTTGIVLDDNSSDDPIKYIATPTDGQTSFILPSGAI